MVSAIPRQALLEAMRDIEGDAVVHPLASIISDLTGFTTRFGVDYCWDSYLRELRIRRFQPYAPKWMVTEALLHEIAHWIAATEDERTDHNLGLETLICSRARELQAQWIQIILDDAAGTGIHPESEPNIRDNPCLLTPRGRRSNALRAYTALERFESAHPGSVTKIVQALRGAPK